MQPPKHFWGVVVIAVAAAVTIAVVVVWVVPSMAGLQRTGMSISNQTLQSVSFDITSSLRSGHLDVGPGTQASFDTATGLAVPESFNATIAVSGGGVVFNGRLNPGVDCWAYFVWTGEVLHLEPSKICT